jgi:hypothetical protein
MFGIKTRIKSYIDRAIAESMSKANQAPVYPALDILLDQHGYEKTLKSKLPQAADGSPLPWYTYPAIEYFDRWDAKGLRVFEYGGGNSSLYWARKGAQVWSVEHDATWWASMGTRSAQLQGLLLREDANTYARAIDEVGGEFDIIVIDGAWRNECATAALAHLRPGGIFILDNSDWYTDVSDLLKKQGFFQVDFNGFGPINSYCWTTSILLPLKSSLEQRIGHPKPVGGIEVFKGDKW